ncbi:hypothetical protein ACHHYP_10345 [Achlya hypogyna]|uniref:Putative sensor domain-containing protein n=1 Tax=Achlya hypogyna TaxID=1202772 RepID=A0A1V9YLR2_ACHHY|nr:hypothetical protein ACHHYP_10345 [Achlya hypogyna]
MYYDTTPMLLPTASVVPPSPHRDTNESFTDQVFDLLGRPFQLVTIVLVPFYVFNLFFAIISAVIVIASTLFGLSLLPLCCFGIIVLQGALYLMLSLAKCDVSLHNCVAPREDRILDTFQMPRQGPFRFAGQRLSPGLTTLFSQESFLAMFYFVALKLPLSIVSSVSSLSLLAVASACFAFPFQYDWFVANKDLTTLKFKHGAFETHATTHPFPLQQSDWPQVVVLGLAILYLTCVWMHVCAAVLRATTKAFLCEYFTASGIVYCQPQGAHVPPSAPPLYGTNVQAVPAYYQKS